MQCVPIPPIGRHWHGYAKGSYIYILTGTILMICALQQVTMLVSIESRFVYWVQGFFQIPSIIIQKCRRFRASPGAFYPSLKPGHNHISSRQVPFDLLELRHLPVKIKVLRLMHSRIWFAVHLKNARYFHTCRNIWTIHQSACVYTTVNSRNTWTCL